MIDVIKLLCESRIGLLLNARFIGPVSVGFVNGKTAPSRHYEKFATLYFIRFHDVRMSGGLG